MKNELKVELYFPGFTRKSVTFTIDDGNIPFDEKFISIVKPGGLKGTFNLCGADRLSPEEYRRLYDGFEIADHCKNHPTCFEDGVEYKFSDELLDKLNSLSYTKENPIVYRTKTDKVYAIHKNPNREKPLGWAPITDKETYVSFVKEGFSELETVFGKGNIKGYVWPFCEQKNEALFDTISSMGYNSIRKTGALEDTTGFKIPSDKMHWSYNATHKNLLSVMELYDKYPDDGGLKFFAFGLHSKDYEVDNKWGDLESFAKLYGNRPSEFWYASVSRIFEYESATKKLSVTESSVSNNSDLTLYLAVNGKRIVLPPNGKFDVKN